MALFGILIAKIPTGWHECECDCLFSCAIPLTSSLHASHTNLVALISADVKFTSRLSAGLGFCMLLVAGFPQAAEPSIGPIVSVLMCLISFPISRRVDVVNIQQSETVWAVVCFVLLVDPPGATTPSIVHFLFRGCV